jgi:hypothetical protein
MGIFDRIRRAVGGGSGDAELESVDRGADADRAGTDAGDDRKTGSHGSHWDAVTASRSEVEDAIGGAVREGERVEGRPLDGATVLGHDHPAGMSVRTRGVSVDGTLVTAFPVGDGATNEATVEGVHEWANGVEAQLELGVAGERIGAFDAGYFGRDREYGAGDDVEVSLSAFAYDLDRAESETVTTEGGEQVSTEGMAGAAPVEGGDLDEFVFQSTPERVVETTFLGRTVYRIRLPLVRTDGGADLSVDLYASHHVTGFRPQEGRDVEGVVWVQTAVA